MLLLTFTHTKDSSTPFVINGRKIYLSEANPNEMSSTVQTSRSIWDASIIMTKYFEYYQNDINLMGKSIVELGAGRGLLGLSLGAMGGTVVLSDVGMVVNSLENSITLNGLDENMTAEEIDWTERRGRRKFDIITCADVVWVAELVEPLIKTLVELSNETTTIYMAHQTRSLPTDQILFKYLAENGFQWSLVKERHPEFLNDSVSIYKVHL